MNLTRRGLFGLVPSAMAAATLKPTRPEQVTPTLPTFHIGQPIHAKDLQALSDALVQLIRENRAGAMTRWRDVLR